VGNRLLSDTDGGPITTEDGTYIVLDALPVVTDTTGADVNYARSRASDYLDDRFSESYARSRATDYLARNRLSDYRPGPREGDWSRRRTP
jgi:hypothetical protein